MTFYRIASTLLGYPDATLRHALPEIAGAIECADGLSAGERAFLVRFVDRLSAADPIMVEEEYVRTFDMVPEHSLHLTHHLIGEDKNRGPALIDLSEFFREHGFEIVEKELPDYLPLLLEFVSLLDAEEGRSFLSLWNKVLRQLYANLDGAGSHYAGLIDLVEARSRPPGTDDARPAPQAAQRTDPCLDDGCFDPPVNWSTPAPCATPRIPDSVSIRVHKQPATSRDSHTPQARERDTTIRR